VSPLRPGAGDLRRIGMPKRVALAVVASGLAVIGSTYLDAQPAPIAVAAKFDTSTEHVLIPITIAGHEFWCNPDTGFSALIALDRSKAAAAGLTIAPGIRTPDGNPPSPGDSSTTATVTVGGVELGDRSIIIRTFPEEAPDMDCIMGLAVLRRFVVEFDHTMPQLLLHERATYRPSSDMQKVPLLFRSNPNVPYVDIELMLPDRTSLPLRVVPDTGAAFYGAALVGEAVSRVQSQLPVVSAITYPDPQSGRVTQLFAARPSAIRVGMLAVEQPVIALVQGTLGGGGIADGLLGSGFFRRFTVAFDFDGQAMYLRANNRLMQPHVLEGSGVGFIRRNGQYVVFQVLPDAPGAAAGVKTGDVLLEIDGRSASALTPVGLRDLLSEAGETRQLLLERDGRRLTFRVQLRRRI
jgi:hypothetical protein